MSRRTADMLIRVGSIYRAAVEQGSSPVEAVAAKLGITYEAAKQRIYRARRAGTIAQTRGVFDKSR